MSFASIVDVTPTTFSASTDPQTVNLPATVNAGDLLILLSSSSGGRTLSAGPSGWTLLDNDAVGGTGRFVIHALKAAGTEGGTTVVMNYSGGTRGAHQVLRIQNWGGALATDVDISTMQKQATGTTVNPPTATAGWGSADNLYIAAAALAASGTTALGAGETIANYGAYDFANSAGANTNCSVAHWTRNLAASSDDPPASSGLGSFDSGLHAVTIVIKPGIAIQNVTSVGAIASAESVPTGAKINLKATMAAIASAEAFGTAMVRMTVHAGTITTEEVVGTPTIAPIQAVMPSSITTEEQFGTPVIQPGSVTISPSSIASAEAFGSPIIGRAIFPSSITSHESFGTPALRLRISPSAIATAEAIGAARIQRSVHPSAIGTSYASGTAVLTVGSVTISPSSIDSEELFGDLVATAVAVAGGRTPPSGYSAFTPRLAAGTAVASRRPPAGGTY